LTAALLEAAVRVAGGRITAALAARFRDLDLAEEALADACIRALEAWPAAVPADPAAWLYRTAERAALDRLRRRQVRDRPQPDAPAPPPTVEERMADDSSLIPDERLRLIFVCCHPAIAANARAALTLRLVCGLSTAEIASAFLLPEATLAQRLVRAKRKIAEAGIGFEIPGPEHWPERLEAVLTTLEIAYAKAHEDGAGSGPHAGFAREVLSLSEIAARLMPAEPEVQAIAALVRYAEARRPARVDGDGVMIPLAEQDPALWDRAMIAAAEDYMGRALALSRARPRCLQAALHGAWCDRQHRGDPPPWRHLLALYNRLLLLRDDPVVRLNRAVVLAEVEGIEAALAAVEALPAGQMADFLPYQAARADLLRRAGRGDEALAAYDACLALSPPPAEARWLARQRDLIRA